MPKKLIGACAAGAAIIAASAAVGVSTASASASHHPGHPHSNRPLPCSQSADNIIDAPHRLFAAWDNGDGNGVAAVFTPDAHMIPSTGVYLDGQSEIAGYWNAALSGPLKGTREIGHPRSIRCLTNNITVVDGDGATLLPGETYTDPAQVPIERRILVSWVGVRDGHSNTWLIKEFQAVAEGQ